MGQRIVTLSVKQDRPTVAEARRRLADGLQTLQRDGVSLVKVVHGYGSTGVGGKIKQDVAATLRRLMQHGIVRNFVPGERWSRTDKTARQLLNDYPNLAEDADLARRNPGMTLVVLARAARRKGRSSSAPPANPPDSGELQEDLDRLLETNPERLYDQYSRPDDIRRLKPE